MTKENAVYIYNGKHHSAPIEENPVTCNNMDELGVHSIKWNKSVTEGQNTAASH
jgi:hypothetical protein